MNFPDDALQGYVSGQWWQKNEERRLRTGVLLWAVVNHVGVLPHRLVPKGRISATAHTTADFKVEKFTASSRPEDQKLPIAALPAYAGESYGVYRAKVRPVLVIACEFPEVDRQTRGRQLRYQTDQAVLVAPYYGVASGKRVGFHEPFLKRIRRCAYPQYMWDRLPLKGGREGSVLRLDHIMPIGNRSDWYNFTDYQLVSVRKRYDSRSGFGLEDPRIVSHFQRGKR